MLRHVRLIVTIALSVFAFGIPAPAAAQDATASRVQVTVLDPSGGVIPDAEVTLTNLEPDSHSSRPIQTRTSDKGIAVLERIAPGRYAVTATFPGFDAGTLKDVRLRPGAEHRLVVVISLKVLEDSVVVSRDEQEAAADRKSSEFGLALSADQIGALADDPAELQRQLLELAGPDAIIRVDSFEGQQLPPKAQIKAIHVTRDQFAAEAAFPGSTFVDVITQPGIGPIRGGANLSVRDGSMTGRSRFADRRGPERAQTFGVNVGGTLVQGRTSFSASVNGQHEFTTPILNVALPTGIRAETLAVRQPNASTNVNALVDHAITRDQTLRVGLNYFRNLRENLGVGNYNLPDRAYSQHQRGTGLRAQQAGPLGRRAFLNTRVSWQWLDLDMHSATNAATIVVQDAFSDGGAQNEQFVKLQQGSIASDLDYVRGRHSWRAGLLIDTHAFSTTSRFNYLGTYTFASVDDYLAGKPLLYTRSLGNPVNEYVNVQGAVYLQDDIRVSKGLTLSPGVRYTMQTRVDDRSGFAPRFGMTWSPGTRGTTTLRASVGIFHSFLSLPMIEQTLRLNGELQREIYLVNPAYPDPGPVDSLEIPTNKYVIGDFNLQRNLRYSAGLEQALSRRLRVNLLYNYMHQPQQPRGHNVNPVVDGRRADPRYANVIEAVTDAELVRHELSVNVLANLAPPGPASAGRTFDWRRLAINAGYGFVRARSNSDGAWSVPQTGNLDDDWGRFYGDQPYRVQMLVTSTQVRNVTATLTYQANAGQVYTQTTGFDDNGDGFVTDRPAGVGLRSLRGAGQATLNARVQYALPLGTPRAQTSGAGVPAATRYRMNVFVNVQNVTNHQNLGGYSGVMTSPFFMQPTMAANPRRVDIGLTTTF